MLRRNDFVTPEEPLIFVPGTLGSWPEPYLAQMAETARDIVRRKVAPERLSLRSVMIRNLAGLIVEAWDRAEDDPLYYRSEVLGESFYIDPIADTYLGWMKHLQAKGLRKDRELFVFGYDTVRVGIPRNGERLRAFTEDVLARTGARKVRIIAHSQGCLVTRYMLQETSMSGRTGAERVASALLTAPPNRGVVNIYFLTEGGFYNEIQAIRPESLADLLDKAREDLSMDMMNAFLAFMEAGPDAPYPQVVRDYIRKNGEPIRQMLPVLPYLYRAPADTASDRINRDQKTSSASVSVPAPRNTFLEHLNGTASLERLEVMGAGHLGILYGGGMNSPSRIYVRPETEETGLWEYGKPVSVDYTHKTDGIVLEDSARLPDDLSAVWYRYEEECAHSGFFFPGNRGFDTLTRFATGKTEG